MEAREVMRRQRADLMALRLLVESLLLALQPASRAIVQRHFELLSERLLSEGLYLAREDASHDELEAALARVRLRLTRLAEQ